MKKLKEKIEGIEGFEEKEFEGLEWFTSKTSVTYCIYIIFYDQFSNIISLELGFVHLKDMDESANTVSIQVNVDY